MSRRTARFEKILLTPGKYNVAYNGSTTVEDEFTVERIANIVNTAQQMRDNGLRIPIPFKHFDSNGHTPTPVTISDSGQEVDPITGQPVSWDSSINGGFADSVYQNEDGALVGVVDSFGDENDLNTPAGKMGTTVQETSIGLAKRYVDGKGNVYNDALVHIAACIKAVEPDQSNFVLLNSEDVSKVTGDLSIVSMSSQLVTMTAPGSSGMQNEQDRFLCGDSDPEIDGENLTADVPSLLNLLRKLESPIDLPADTTDINLVERLVIAVNQKICDEESDEQIEPGEGNAKPKPPQDAQEKQGTYTMTTPAAVVPTPPSEESLLLMSMLANQHKSGLETRIAALKAKGITDDMLNKHVTPFMGLELTTMSIGDFDKATGKVSSLAKAELAISILEDQQVTTMNLSDRIGYSPDFTEVGYSETNNFSEAEAKEVAEVGNMIQNGSMQGFHAAQLIGS